MRVNVRDRIIGDTYKPTWVSSGGAPDSLTSSLINQNGTLFDQQTAVSSGGGFFFAVHQLPNTPGYCVNEWRAQVGSFTYVNRQLVNLVDLRSD